MDTRMSGTEQVAHFNMLKARMAAFVEKYVNPGAAERDHLALPIQREIMVESARVGLLSASFPKDLGGGGLDPLTYGLFLEELGRVSEDFSFVMLASLFPAVSKAILETADAVMIDRYIQPAIRGECFASFAYTEGADPFSFQTGCVKDRDDYVINGEKYYVMGGMLADIFMVYVRDENNDLLPFIIERQDPGVEVIPLTNMSGLRAVGLAKLCLKSVRIPVARLVVSADGLSHVQRFLNLRRISAMCALVGRMDAILDDLVRNLNSTIRYGQPVSVMANVQAVLGKMYVSIETSRSMLYRSLHRLQSDHFDPHWDPILAATKYWIVDQANQLMLNVYRLAGGKGYVHDQHYGRFQRDFAGLIPTVGAQDVLEVDLGVWASHGFEMRTQKENEACLSGYRDRSCVL
jgi:Acyl-CoA dehydrogenases